MSWMITSFKYGRQYDKKFDDDMIRRSWDEAMSVEESVGAGMESARSHGNPFFDTFSAARQEGVTGMTAQMEHYRAEDALRAAGGKTFGYKEYFEELPRVCQYVQGFHIFDIDDPAVVEHSEAQLHEELTSYLAEPALKPKEEEWQHYITAYIDYLFVSGIAHGFVPPGITLEPARQRLGLPYEWLGAPID